MVVWAGGPCFGSCLEWAVWYATELQVCNYYFPIRFHFPPGECVVLLCSLRLGKCLCFSFWPHWYLLLLCKLQYDATRLCKIRKHAAFVVVYIFLSCVGLRQGSRKHLSALHFSVSPANFLELWTYYFATVYEANRPRLLRREAVALWLCECESSQWPSQWDFPFLSPWPRVEEGICKAMLWPWGYVLGCVTLLTWA